MIVLSSHWHATKEEEVLRDLETSLEGLSLEEANIRLTKFGYNELKKQKKKFRKTVNIESFLYYILNYSKTKFLLGN
jgi:hypothetical protein